MRKDVQKALEKYEIEIPPFGGKKDIAKGEELLRPDEMVLFAAPTNASITHANTRKAELKPGAAFLTAERFLFYSKMLSISSTESIPLSEIQSVDCSTDLMKNSINIHTLTKTLTISFFYTYEVIDRAEMTQKILACFKEAIDRVASVPSDEPTTTPVLSPVDEILKYKNLLDCGAITQEEYDAKKKQLLGI